ncbi:hypothetical protein CNMCM6106_005319 [Aspergillus hiratsukae]|nr:hypothetical protein CNMCM6106_005319 [Aspergillus hiratsukae]
MIDDAAKFKSSDEAFTKKFESRQQLESYISRVEEIISDPTMSLKLKRGNKEKIESALSDAMAQLEIEDSAAEDFKKKELALKRLITKAMATRPTALDAFQRWRFLTPPKRFNLTTRSFSNSASLRKKKDTSRRLTGANTESSILSEDPYDLSSLEKGIVAAVARLKDELSKLRMGGRFNTESLEDLKVSLSKGSKETISLGELAQVVPKGGRMITILASEEEHMKPITSAILSSDLSLTPQPDPHNIHQLNISIPPPTKELREQTVVAARAAMEKAAGAVRESRSVSHKRLQDMQRKRLARPDDIRKAQEQMERMAEKGQKEVKELFDAAKKALERV